MQETKLFDYHNLNIIPETEDINNWMYYFNYHDIIYITCYNYIYLHIQTQHYTQYKINNR